jgi:hypothetical protein
MFTPTYMYAVTILTTLLQRILHLIAYHFSNDAIAYSKQSKKLHFKYCYLRYRRELKTNGLLTDNIK